MQQLNTDIQEQHSPYEKQHNRVFGRTVIFSRPWSCSKNCYELGEPRGKSWFQLTASQCYLRDQKASQNQQNSQTGTEHSSKCSQGGLQIATALAVHALILLWPQPPRETRNAPHTLKPQDLNSGQLCQAAPPLLWQTQWCPADNRTVPGLQESSSQCASSPVHNCAASVGKATTNYCHGNCYTQTLSASCSFPRDTNSN